MSNPGSTPNAARPSTAIRPSREARDFYRAILYGVTEFNEDRFRLVHARHLAMVESYFAGTRARDLLRMDITRGDGWEKLCPFLGVPVPDLPFPRSNPAETSTAVYHAQKRGLRGVVERLWRGD